MPIAEAVEPIAAAAHIGLSATPKTLPPWLFYDEAGSQLFEQITALPEYYLTRTERALFAAHAQDILDELASDLTIAELGAGTANKTGLLLAAVARQQRSVLYQPIDVSPSALAEARESLERDIPGVTVHPQIANYVTEPIRIERSRNVKVLALYIGSSIGNFTPPEALGILGNLRRRLQPGDALLLGTDLAPGPTKPVECLLAAYNDSEGVTAAFNYNILTRLNRDCGTDFDLAAFRHEAIWNAEESRIEMHLRSTRPQTVTLPASSVGPALTLHLGAGETIHTENSYKFTSETISALLAPSGFTATRTFCDPEHLFAVTLATAV